MTTDIQPKLYDQRPNETDKEYIAFSTYLALGYGRSLLKANNLLYKSPTTVKRLERLSSTYNWVERAKAYDLDQAKLLEQARNDARAKIQADELHDYEIELEKYRAVAPNVKPIEATKRINIPGVEGEFLATIHDLSPVLNLLDWRDQISKLGRRAAGLPDKITATDITSAGAALPAGAGNAATIALTSEERRRALEIHKALGEKQTATKPDSAPGAEIVQ